MVRAFGRRPSFLRWRLSWEWLLDEWVEGRLERSAGYNDRFRKVSEASVVA